MTRYRNGRHLGRTIYRQMGENPSDQDEFVGIMDTREMAGVVVDALNHLLNSREGTSVQVPPPGAEVQK